jgi:PAS domain S-box-containing protein
MCAMDADVSYLDYLPVFETLNEAIVIFDNEKFLWVNDAYLKLKGLDSPDEIIGMPIFDGIHPGEVQEGMRVVSERAKTGKGSSGVWRLRRKDGSYQTVISHASILPNIEETVSVAIVRPVEAVQGVFDKKITEAGFHHEIRSALTVILGYLDLLKNHEDVSTNPELKKWIDAIVQNYMRIEAIMHKIGEN